MNINSSLFGKIRPVLSEQSDIKDICETLSRGFSPLAVSGLSSIHKSQLAMLLSDHLYGEKSVPMLLIADDEAGAKKLCDDINEMYGETLAFVYPAKDITLARVDSVSREYEHQRLCVLSRIIDGSCRIVCASAEAAMQKTIPPKALSDNTIILSRENPVDLPALVSRLVRAGYTRCDKVESPSQFSVRGSIADIFPVQEKFP
ncbi:MAG: transcription-repair coupling factor, partial [Oscillospiraceae bacterium]|nr:transcription-repair coupling factor [Oscillospiraceae bacterium]